jgi:hypothetical protein
VIVVGLLATVGVLVRAEPACACSCVAFTDAEAMARADAVFAGTVVDVDSSVLGSLLSSTDPVTVTLQVSTVYKGDVPAEVQVKTVASEVSCGYPFGEGSRYLVHVQIDEAGDWNTGLCSNNKVLPAAGEPTTGPVPTVGYPPTPVSQPPTRQLPWVLFVAAGAAATAIAVLLLVRARRRPAETTDS